MATSFIIRLGVRDSDTVKKALSSIGKEGEAALKKLERQTNLSSQGMKRFSTNTRASAAAMSAARSAIVALAAALSVRQLAQYADTWTQVNNRLKLVTDSAAQAADVQQRLFAVAQEARGQFADLAELYARVALASKELGVSQEEQIRFTEGVAKALAITGTSAEQARGSLLQLGQAIGSGVVRAEEFNSILEGTPRIAKAVAEGLKEAGGSVARLRTLVIDGKVSSEAFFNAFLSQLPQLRTEFDQTDATIGQAFTTLSNAFLKFIGLADDSTSASQNLAGALIDLAGAFDIVREHNAALNKEIEENIDSTKEMFRGIEQFLRENNLGFLLTDRPPSPTGAGLAGSPELGGRRREQRQIETEPVSIEDLPVDATKGSESKKSKSTKAASTKAASRSDPVGAALGSFRAAQEQSLKEGADVAGRVEDANAYLNQLREASLRANGEIIKVIELRRDRDIAALKNTALSAEQSAEARVLIEETASADIDAVHKRATDQITQHYLQIGSVISGTFADIARDGKVTVETLLRLFERLANQLATILGSQQAGGGGGGAFGSLFGAFSSLFGGGGQFAGGSGPAPGSFRAAQTHSGGIVGREQDRFRALPASTFAGAPRMHRGGYLAPDEVPAVLQRGEGVFTRGQMAALGQGREVNIVINNNAPGVDVRARKTDDGPVIDIDEMVANTVSRHGSKANRAVANQIAFSSRSR